MESDQILKIHRSGFFSYEHDIQLISNFGRYTGQFNGLSGNRIEMKYIYKSSWAVIGGINFRKDEQTIVLFESELCRFILTNRPDQFLFDIDRGVAFGRLMLRGLSGKRGNEQFSVALNTEIEEIKN